MCSSKPKAPAPAASTAADKPIVIAEKPRVIRNSSVDSSSRRRQVRNIIGGSLATTQLGNAATGKQQLGA